MADEHRSTFQLGEFSDGQLKSMRLDQELATGPRDFNWANILSQHSGIILGGSPFNSSDPVTHKTPLQLRVEAELARMLTLVVAQDYPFLGACYGVGTLGIHQGGTVDTTYGEPAGVVRVHLTDDGAMDPLLEGVTPEFDAFVGHKEAINQLPPGAVLLAQGQACPTHMFRVKQNLYATQFHPELDQQGILYRLELYSDQGYYDTTEQEALFAAIRSAEVTQPQRILANFARRYARKI